MSEDLFKINELLKEMGGRTKDGKPNMNYFSERFRDYELAILNVKQMGYEIGKMYARERLCKTVTEPQNVDLTSKLCTQSDVESDWFQFWSAEIKLAPVYHRKLWELCYISQVFYRHGLLTSGKRGLVFGCGEEPLPSLYAKYGCSILATDLETDKAEEKGWVKSSEHAQGIEKIRRKDICPDEKALKRIRHDFVDMNDIPPSLDGEFDFCWSACALEHLGSLKNGADFIENSLRTLKPGGLAVHTTEFNLQDGETIDDWVTVLFQKKHIEDIVSRLESAGHSVSPVDFAAGDSFLDGFVDLPPWHLRGISHIKSGNPHLKLSIDGFPCTSIGLIIKKSSAR